MQCPVCESRETRHFERIENRVYWRCNRCEATFLDPAQRPSAEEEQAQYRLHNNEINDAGYRQFLARLAEPLLQRLQPGSKGLDYGCGPGPALADMLSKAGHCMTLYDPLFFPETTALQSRYDFITCTEVVEHFHQPAQEFRRLDQLLKPGGWLGIMTSLQTDDAAFANWHYRRDPTHVVFYRLGSFQHIASQRGWGCESPAQNIVLCKKKPE